MIRTFLPSDLLTILFFQNRALSNRAKTKDNIIRDETRFSTLAALLGQCFHPQIRKCLWVWATGVRLRGVASVRNRSSARAWEVDRLLLEEGDGECCYSLLESLSLAGLQAGVEKVFLRLPSDSPLADSAQEAGFLPYVTEFAYGLETEEAPDHGDIPPLQPRRKQVGDDYRLFELYQKCIPTPVRRVEGATFREWHDTKDRGAKTEWVFEREGNLTGWLRMESTRDTGQLEVMASDEKDLEQIVAHTLISLDSYRHLLCLVPEFQVHLARLLRDHGFDEIRSYSVFIKELTARAQDPCLVPLGA